MENQPYKTIFWFQYAHPCSGQGLAFGFCFVLYYNHDTFKDLSLNHRRACLPFALPKGRWEDTKGLSELKWFSLQPYFKLLCYQNKLKYYQSSVLYPSLGSEAPLNMGWQVLSVDGWVERQGPEHKIWKLPHCSNYWPVTNYIIALCFVCSCQQIRYLAYIEWNVYCLWIMQDANCIYWRWNSTDFESMTDIQ